MAADPPYLTGEVLSPAEIARDEMLAAGYVVVEPEDDDVIVVDDVVTERVRWLWAQRLPLGKVSLLDGDPGRGKSTLTIDIAARLTTGRPMPDGDDLAGGPTNVLIVSAEDGPGDTIRPRLEAAGADLKRVFLFDRVRDYDERNDCHFVRPVEFPKDLPRLGSIIARHEVALVVLDPLVAFLDARTDAHRDQDVRRVLYPLSQIAESTGAAVLCLRHLNKTPGTNPLYRGGGSIGFVGAARMALLVGAHPEDDERRVLAVSKSNLARVPESLVFRLCADDFRSVACIGWEAGTSPLSASELLACEQKSFRPARNTAEDFLSGFLARNHGPVPAATILAEAEEVGIAERTLRRAKAALGVKSIRASTSGADPGHGEWLWCFEEDESVDDPPAVLDLVGQGCQPMIALVDQGGQDCQGGQGCQGYVERTLDPMVDAPWYDGQPASPQPPGSLGTVVSLGNVDRSREIDLDAAEEAPQRRPAAFDALRRGSDE